MENNNYLNWNEILLSFFLIYFTFVFTGQVRDAHDSFMDLAEVTTKSMEIINIQREQIDLLTEEIEYLVGEQECE